jgi:signal peptidase II
LVRNTGVAFSQGRGLGPVVALAVILVIVFLIRIGAKAGDPITRTAVGGVVGGAIGNLIDRIVRSDAGPFDGAVVDFVDLGWWPVFNLADAAIVVGGAVIVWSGLIR